MIQKKKTRIHKYLLAFDFCVIRHRYCCFYCRSCNSTTVIPPHHVRHPYQNNSIDGCKQMRTTKDTYIQRKIRTSMVSES